MYDKILREKEEDFGFFYGVGSSEEEEGDLSFCYVCYVALLTIGALVGWSVGSYATRVFFGSVRFSVCCVVGQQHEPEETRLRWSDGRTDGRSVGRTDGRTPEGHIIVLTS